MWPEILLAVITGVIIYLFLIKKRIRVLPMGDGWWGRGQKPDAEEDTTIYPFKVETSDAEINDLHRRLEAARYTEPLEDSFFHYGINTNYLKKVVSYWRNEFDWKKQVEVLNKFPHFKTKIEGIDVHFVHVKPSHVPEGQSAKPLLMVHGWPGSFFEFYKIIPLLTDPASHILNGEHVFEVICPSIPGYAFSEAPHKKGFDSVCAARVFYKLMMRLGHSEFYIQGGDWGSVICTNLAQIAPSHVKGIHLNMAPVTVFGPRHLLSVLFGQFFPRLFGFDDDDVRHFFPFTKKLIYKFANESGYFHIQSTKPDSAGCALNDSPAGMAGCLLEKFSTWTNMKCQDLEDGGLEKKFDLDELLTSIMIYWVSGCIVPSMRFYKENMKHGIGLQKHEWLPVYVPTGIAAFRKEMIHVPRAWAERKYVNIISYNHTSRGGHFAAFEEPAILAADIVQFVGKVVEGRGKGKYSKCGSCGRCGKK